MSMDQAEEKDQTGLWRFTTVGEFKVPADVLGVGSVKKSLHDLAGRFIARERRTESPLDPEQNLLSLPSEELDRVVPEPDWESAADALHECLGPWLEAEHRTKPVIFFVAPPYAGRMETLFAWAEKHEVRVIEEPEESHIIDCEVDWFRSWPDQDLWLLPRLEKCFFRQAEGLDLVREFLARVLSGDMGQGIIGCDSWAWSFLQHVWLGRPSFTITSQPIDHERLRLLFSSVLPKSSDVRAPSFRRADNGAFVLNSDRHEAEAQASDSFLRHLAAYSRGNLGVARAYWQRALRTLPEKQIEDEDDPDRRLLRTTIWVTPWEDLEHPVLPAQTGETARFVLHALLLHGGLTADRLALMLPSDRAATIEALLFLTETELVECSGETWRVTAFGYPVVRSVLQANDYLTDSF